MDNAFVFHPDRRLGLVFHSVVILVLVAIGVWGVVVMTRTKVSPIFFLYLIPVLLSLALLPAAAYRAYTLYRAEYRLSREGMQLRWGLRVEDIPLNLVESVDLVEKSGLSVPEPRLRWPGSVTGVLSLPDERKIEYMASNIDQLVLVSTPQVVFAISPKDRQAFLDAYQQFALMGSLDPIPPRSVHPSLFLAQVWGNKPARYLIIAGLILSLALLFWVSVLIPGLDAIRLGFGPEGNPGDPVPPGQLLLLPLANGVFFLADVILGLFLFRRSLNSEERIEGKNRTYEVIAYFLWASGVFTALLFILAVFIILQA